MMMKAEVMVAVAPEIPEDLHESMVRWLESHPDWDENRMYAAALSLFLFQNTHSESLEAPRHYRRTARIYLDSL